MKGSGIARFLVLAGAPLFCVLAIANSAGYRHGVSDLAFYLPAAFRAADLSLFPRDAALLAVQARLTLADETMAAALRLGAALGLDAPGTIYALHLGSLLLLYGGVIALGRALFRSWWAVAAFVAAMTLRHAVARAGVNTLEGYFHPRIVAFGLCVIALAVFVRRGVWPALAVALAASALHPTTAFWFLICLGVAGLVSERRDRLPLLALGIVAALLLAAAMAFGPLAGRLVVMDAAWLQVLVEKDYLFPDRWPLYGWLTCAGYVGAIALAARARSRAGLLTPRERGLLLGTAALLAIFLLVLPPLVGRVALAVQLQPSRIFWILDLIATVGVIWLVAESGTWARRRAVALALVLILLSATRGVYLLTIQFPERSLTPAASAPTPWDDAMRWAAGTDKRSHWLAHPNHAFLYGSSLRVAGRRDLFHEAGKDPAVALYDRGLAMRVAERAQAVSDFDALTPERLRALAAQYDLDYVITDTDLALPVTYRNEQFRVYRLR